MMCIDLKLYLSRYGFKITLSAFISSIPASISFSFNRNVDRQSSNYMRFVTHIKFFVERYFTNSMLSSKDDLLYNQIKNAHQQEMAIAEKIKLYLEQKYEKTITNDELTFLVIHIARIIQD